jgi:hypothetical protein
MATPFPPVFVVGDVVDGGVEPPRVVGESDPVEFDLEDDRGGAAFEVEPFGPNVSDERTRRRNHP